MVDGASPEVWSGERADRWVRQSAGLERQLAPVAEVLLSAVRLRAGESVLDIGCGTGPTTYAAARAVGPTGRVAGLDVSVEMLAAAASTQPTDGARHAPISWVRADAVTWSPGPERFDAVISRFGVMFFSDPLAAFSNMAVATRPGGRLAIAVWQRRDHSELFSVSLHAAIAALRSRNVLATTDGVGLDDFIAIDYEGPFSLHDPIHVTELLTQGGWGDVRIESHLLALPFAGGLEPAAAAEAALDFGPTRLVVAGMDRAVLDDAAEAIRTAFEKGGHTDRDGHVVLSGAVNIVTAVRR